MMDDCAFFLGIVILNIMLNQGNFGGKQLWSKPNYASDKPPDLPTFLDFYLW